METKERRDNVTHSGIKDHLVFLSITKLSFESLAKAVNGACVRKSEGVEGSCGDVNNTQFPERREKKKNESTIFLLGQARIKRGSFKS